MAKQTPYARAARPGAPRRHCVNLFLAGCGLLFCAGAPAAHIDEAQRLLDEQRARGREEWLQQPQPSIRRETAPGVDVSADPASLPETEPAFDIQRITLKDDALLDADEQDAILRPFTGLRLGEKRINLLLRRLTGALIDKGYVTSRAYIGPQKLASGVLEVTLVAGRVEAVQFNGRAASGGDWAPLPFRADEVLRLADLEQGVDQINRLRSSRAEMRILPGQTPGGSIVDIRSRVHDSWRVSVGADNHGQDSTGTVRGRVMVEADNVLGLFDAWNLTHIQSADSKASLLSVSVPWGYSTLSYTYTLSDYRSPIADVAVIAGDSSNHTLGWNRVVHRDAVSKTAFDASLTLRRAQRDVAGVSLAPQDMSVLRVAASRLRRWQGADLSLDLGYVQGLAAFGADVDVAGLAPEAPHVQFEKLDFAASATVSLGTDFAYRGALAGQRAQRGLQSAGQIFIGGAATVRGFKEGALAGDRGAYTRQELHWTSAAQGAAAIPYVFFDYGRVRLIADPNWNHLASYGLGARLTWKGFSADAHWARPVSAPDWVLQRTRLHLSLNYQF